MSTTEKKKHMVISIDSETLFDKIQHPFMIKILQKAGIEGTCLNINSLQFSHSVMFTSLRVHGLQHARLPCAWPTPHTCSNSCPLIQWCHPTISSSVVPFCSFLQSCPASRSLHQSFQWIFRTYYFEYWLVWSPCCPRDSQESSPTPQFKRINSSVLSLLYSIYYIAKWISHTYTYILSLLDFLPIQRDVSHKAQRWRPKFCFAHERQCQRMLKLPHNCTHLTR